MPDFIRLAAIAESCGFTHSAPLDISTLEFLQDVRDMCSTDKCRRYDKSWACPPACGSLDEMTARVRDFSYGFLVQTVGELEDSYDWEGIQDAAKRQAASFGRMWDELDGEYASIFAMGTGGCSKCEKCTYPDAPCRYPERMAPSMEACGLYVSKVCTDNNLAYNYGSGKIAYTACFLFGDDAGASE